MLSCGAVCVIPRLTVLVKRRLMIDGQTLQGHSITGIVDFEHESAYYVWVVWLSCNVRLSFWSSWIP